MRTWFGADNIRGIIGKLVWFGQGETAVREVGVRIFSEALDGAWSKFSGSALIGIWARFTAVGVLIVGLSGCMPSRADFKEHCIEIAEVEIQQKDLWDLYLNTGLKGIENLGRRPVVHRAGGDIIYVFTHDYGIDSPCNLETRSSKNMPKCKNGVIYKAYSNIWASKNKLVDGKEEHVERIYVGRIRNDFYTGQILEVITHYCIPAFQAEYFMELKRSEVNG